MFTFRFLLGLGIGLKSTTIPIYASECVPANVRGTLVMMWQVFTAFGIMCGYFAGAAFGNVLSGNNINICPNDGRPTLLLSTKCVSYSSTQSLCNSFKEPGRKARGLTLANTITESQLETDHW